MIRKILPTLLAVLLVCSFTGCRSRTNTSSGVSSTVSNAASGTTGGASASPNASASPHTSAAPDTSVAPEGTLGTFGPFREALRGVYGEKYYPDTELSETEIREELGLDDTLYEEVYAERSAQKAHPDTFIAVKVKEGKTEEVKEKLLAYKQRLAQDNSFAAYAEKINAAEVYAEGDYVFFVLLGDVEDNVSSEGMAEAFGKEIQRGIDAIKKAIGVG
ncbi:MAG: DUF4358 domain-containing protein [Hominenteromicrobium sp.]